MANVNIREVEGGENTNPAATEGIELDSGTASTWTQIANLHKNMTAASTTVASVVELATAAETTTGTDATRAVTPQGLMQSIFSAYHTCQGRLTLTSGTPVTTADVTGATSVYFAPHKGNLTGLYDGSNWALYSFSELTLALGTLTAGLPYDVFIYNNSGTLTLESLAWTNTTTRATALTTQDGVLVKTGATTRRYLGTFYTSSTTQTEDSTSKRYLFNYYNRARRFLKAVDTTNSWSYTTAAWREANGGSTLGTTRFDIMVGYPEDVLTAEVYSLSSSGSAFMSVGVGIDSTTVNSALLMGAFAVSGSPLPISAYYKGYPGVGKHTISWLEYGGASGTFYGDNNLTIAQSGIVGEFWC
jgi:hypothetical protein